jgi:hypothetical protein
MIANALELLPPLGKEVEFDVYKSKLYAANPEKGRDVFAHLIKKDLIGKKLSHDENLKIVVLLFRKAGN